MEDNEKDVMVEEQTTESSTEEAQTPPSGEGINLANNEAEVENTEEQKADAEEKADDTETDEEQEKPVKMSGVDKRIVKLLKRVEALESENKNLSERLGSKETGSKERFYTDQELDAAESHAVNQGDMDLLANVHRERIKNLERKMMSMTQENSKLAAKAQSEKLREWQSVKEDYAISELPAPYSNDPDFDIANPASKLYMIADRLYREMATEYQRPGGIKQAVADAIFELQRIKSKDMKSSKDRKADRKLAKAKMKAAPGASGISQGPDKGVRPSGGNNLDDYFNERQADQNKRKYRT